VGVFDAIGLLGPAVVNRCAAIFDSVLRSQFINQVEKKLKSGLPDRQREDMCALFHTAVDEMLKSLGVKCTHEIAISMIKAMDEPFASGSSDSHTESQRVLIDKISTACAINDAPKTDYQTLPATPKAPSFWQGGSTGSPGSLPAPSAQRQHQAMVRGGDGGVNCASICETLLMNRNVSRGPSGDAAVSQKRVRKFDYEEDPSDAQEEIVDHDNANRQFADISQTVRTLGRSLMKFDNTSPEQRAYLISSLIDMASGPDIPVAIQSNNSLNAFELRSANFVLQRYLSSMVKGTMDSVLMSIASVNYRFAQPDEILKNNAQLQERLLSVLLGYDYPYLTSEQPRRTRYLSLDVVIPFLFRHRSVLIKMVDEDGSSVEMAGVSLEADIHKSHLFRAITAKDVFHHSSEGQVPSEQRSALINQWYTKWTTANDTDNELDHKSLVCDLVTFLVQSRYRFSKDEQRIKELEGQLDEWRGVEAHLQSFSGYVSKFQSRLVGNDKLPDESKHWIPIKKERFDVHSDDESPQVKTRDPFSSSSAPRRTFR